MLCRWVEPWEMPGVSASESHSDDAGKNMKRRVKRARLQERSRTSFHISASTDLVLTTTAGPRAAHGEEGASSSAEDGEGDGTLRDRAKRKKEKKMSKEQREKEAAELLRQAEDQAAALLGVLSLARGPLSPSPFPASIHLVQHLCVTHT